MCAGGIQASGSSPASSSRSCSSQSLSSVFARCLRPRLAAVSAGSARRATCPARSITSTTNRHPVVPSSTNSASKPANCSSQARTGSRAAGLIRPRRLSPLPKSSVLKVIWLRCTSNALTIRIGTSSNSTVLTTRVAYHACAEEAPPHVIYESQVVIGACSRSRNRLRGEVALEAAVCFALRLAFLHAALDVGDRRGVPALACDEDHVQRAVEFSVA